MPDVKYDRDTVRMDCLGLDLNRPVDYIRPGRFPYLKNVRSYQEGQIRPRPGLTNIGAIASPFHSFRRLSDPRTADFTYILGGSTKLYFGKGPFAQVAYNAINVIVSGDPLALVTQQPEQSPQSWMFVADRTIMRKVSVAGLCHQIGLPAITTPPTVALGIPQYKYTDPDFDFEYANNGALQADWIAAGTAGLATLVTRINTTIAAILFDSGTTGWACVQPTSAVQFGAGAVVNVSGVAERIIVQEMHPVSAATTIAAISYDSGTAGLCSIVLTGPTSAAEVNAMINNTTLGEFNRVLSVNKGADGTVSIRISTAATYVVGNAIQFVASFRAYFVNTHAAADTLTSKGADTAVTVGTGTLTRTAAYDFSSIAASVPSFLDDYIHVSLRADHPELITEIKLMFDIDSATNDFTRNLFYAAIRPSDITPSASNAQTLLTNRLSIIQRDLIDQPLGSFDNPIDPGKQDEIQDFSDNTSIQEDPGVTQWSELRLKLSDFIRIGTDLSRGWNNIAKVRLQVVTTGTVAFDVDDIHLGGGYGPDQSDTSIPYIYRYRARVTSTGAKSNPSPPLRGGISPYRQQVIVTMPQYTAAPEADVLDIERFGGDIPSWHYVGTTPNSATPSFTDKYIDDAVAGSPDLGTVNYQLWPIKDIPRTGTTGIVSGTTVNDAGTNFNVLWSQGTGIIVNGIPCTIYKVISTSKLEIFENLGSLNAVAWNIPEPVLIGQPLPCLWGPLDTVLFACGDTLNPGRLYFTQVNSEGTASTDYYDVTSPSEPLMNGLVYNGVAYVWSSERMFRIIAVNSPARYEVREIPSGKGLFSRWSLTRDPGPLIYYLSRDGIYQTDGGTSESITDEWLNPIFPTEAQIGTSTTVLTPGILAANVNNLRLDYALTYLYFDYTANGENRASLIWDPSKLGWLYDEYNVAINFHYGDEGAGTNAIFACGQAGTLYQLLGITDDGADINCIIRTPSRDQGDPRSNKFYGDVMLDCDPQGTNVVVTPGTDNYGTTYPTTTLNHTGRAQKPINVQSATWTTAKNIALNIAFKASTPEPTFYIWEPRWVFESAPISAFSWEISPSTLGMDNFKSLGYGKICHVSTADLTLTVTTDGTVQTGITITNSGGIYKETFFRFPVYKGKIYHFRISSGTEWRLSGRDSYIEIKEWAGAGAFRKMRIFGDYSFIEG